MQDILAWGDTMKDWGWEAAPCEKGLNSQKRREIRKRREGKWGDIEAIGARPGAWKRDRRAAL